MEANTVDSSRRDFNSLVVLAVSGLISGAIAATDDARGQDRPPPPPREDEVRARERRPAVQQTDDHEQLERPERPGVKKVDLSNPLLSEPHVCRGLNTCKGKGRDGRNACAGQGICATAGHHMCKGNNQCRGLGACEEGQWPQHQPGYPGENTCRGKGGCQVPMYPDRMEMWHRARFRFAALMLDAGKRVGNPPR